MHQLWRWQLLPDRPDGETYCRCGSVAAAPVDYGDADDLACQAGVEAVVLLHRDREGVGRVDRIGFIQRAESDVGVRDAEGRINSIDREVGGSRTRNWNLMLSI